MHSGDSAGEGWHGRRPTDGEGMGRGYGWFSHAAGGCVGWLGKKAANEQAAYLACALWLVQAMQTLPVTGALV